MPKFKKLWRCDECLEIHDDEGGASECCKPSITELYECAGCEGMHDSEGEAVDCCAGTEVRCGNCSRDYGESNINALAIDVAGHCTVCNPLYTLDQRLIIEDIYYLKTGGHGDLRMGQS